MFEELRGKKLLILGGFTNACDIVRRAQEMGVYVIVADYNESVPANGLADKFVAISARDIDALESFCREEGIDGVTTGFVDILMPACYELCQRLGLPYYATPKMLSMATNKDDFKKTCNEYGIPVPRTYFIGKALSQKVLTTITYPVFVKPMDASGSRGAGVCNNEQELMSQFEEAVSYSGTDNAIIEDYITGREFLLDYIAVDGEFRLLSMFDRYMCSDRGSAINYSNLSMAPAKEIDNYLAKMNGKVISMFKALGFRDGLFFMQGHTDGNKITFYEMGCRLGGSFYKLERACIGYDPVEMVVRYALTGKMVEDIKKISPSIAKFDKYAVVDNYLLKGDDETISAIYGLEEIASMPSCVAYSQYRFVGQSYKKDSIVDKPVLTAYLLNDSLEKIKYDITYVNTLFEVKNEKGNSLLMEKIDPEVLYK